MDELKKVTKLVNLSLAGCNGNAFSLMAKFTQEARRQKTPKEEIDAVIAECQTGDYDHLLQTLIANTSSNNEFLNDDDF